MGAFKIYFFYFKSRTLDNVILCDLFMPISKYNGEVGLTYFLSHNLHLSKPNLLFKEGGGIYKYEKETLKSCVRGGEVVFLGKI